MRFDRHRAVLVGRAGLALGCALWFAGGPEAAAQQCSASTSRTAITFKKMPNGKEIKILSLVDLATGTPLQAGGSAIWQVVFAANPTGLPPGSWDEKRVPPAAPTATICPGGTVYRHGYPIARPVAESGVQVVQAGQGCVIVWDDVALPAPPAGVCAGNAGHFDVVLTIQPKTIGAQEFLSWRIQVTMADDACDYWRIKNVKMPLFALRELGADGDDDFVAYPANQGTIVQNPIMNEQPYPEEPLALDPNMPYNDRIARRFTYPARVQAQYMAYYDDTAGTGSGQDSTAVGLWMGADDEVGFVKRLYFGTIENENPLTVDRFLQMHFTHINGGESFDDFKTFDTAALRADDGVNPTGYEMLMTTYSGDWWDAAMIYRRWMQSRNPQFLVNGTLTSQVAAGDASVRARVELGAGVVSRHDDSGLFSRDNINDPNSEFSKLRAWSEFYRRVNHPTLDPLDCMELAANFNNRGNLISADSFCNDESVAQTPLQPGINMIRSLRVPLTISSGGVTTDIPPLYRWTIANSDAGNYNTSAPAGCTQQDWVSFGLPRYWNGDFVVDGSANPLKSFTSSGSDWLTNCLRIPRWTEFMLITNAVPGMTYVPSLCPNSGPCPIPSSPVIPPGFQVDWKGFNAIAFTGDNPVSFPSYAPLHSPGHTHRGATQSGGGTYWMDNDLAFMGSVKTALFNLSLTLPTPSGSPAPQPDLAAMIAGTERAHEWIIPEASWFGKTRTAPFDTAQRASIDWVSTVGARFVPFLSMIYHDYVTMGGHLLERSELLKFYAGKPLAQVNTTSPVEMESLRTRSDAAQIVLGGSFPSLSMSTDVSEQESGQTYSPILFDGPPDPGFTNPVPNPVSWIGTNSALQADYTYFQSLFALRPLFKDHLIYGRRFRDPAILPRTPQCLTTFGKRFIRPEYDGACVNLGTEFFHDMVHVYGTMFTSPVGTPAFFFTNYYRTDLGVCSPPGLPGPDYAFQFSFDPSELGLAAGTYRLWKVEKTDCTGEACTEQTALGTFTVDANGQSPVFTSGFVTLPPAQSLVLYASPTAPCGP